MQGNAGEAGDDGAYTSLCQLSVYVISLLRKTAVIAADSFPGGGSDKPVFQCEVIQGNLFKYLGHSGLFLLYTGCITHHDLLQRNNKKAVISLSLHKMQYWRRT